MEETRARGGYVGTRFAILVDVKDPQPQHMRHTIVQPGQIDTVTVQPSRTGCLPTPHSSANLAACSIQRIVMLLMKRL